MMTGVTTGIKYLDHIIGGGFEKGSIILINGHAGTGKTTLALHFITEGLAKKEKVLYISFEETLKNIEKTAERFGWSLKSNNLVFREISPFNFDRAMKEVFSHIKKEKPDRVVFDTITCFTIYMSRPIWKSPPVKNSNMFLFVPSPADTRRSIYEMAKKLREAGSTVLLLSEEADSFVMINESLGFLCDGIIELRIEEIGTAVSRTMQVKKMRRTSHPLDRSPMEICSKGIEIKSIK